MQKVFYAIILSVFIHILLMVWFDEMPLPAPVSKRDTVEIELKPVQEQPKNKAEKQLVREALLPDRLKAEESDDPLRFLSNQTQRVKKQTQAANTGMTQNRMNKTSGEQHAQQKNSENKPEKILPKLNKDALIEAAEEVGGKPGLPEVDAPGVSTIGESLPQEVQVGSFTALNTDRYLYYSFFARVEELIRFRWETSVERALDVVPREKLAANINHRWTTQLEILLNPKGEFVKVLLMKQSGIPAFDQAPAMAFAQARYFPNPPKEMIEDDGLIHLKYAFTVYADPQFMARPGGR